jgi:hypothetical protein
MVPAISTALVAQLLPTVFDAAFEPFWALALSLPGAGESASGLPETNEMPHESNHDGSASQIGYEAEDWRYMPDTPEQRRQMAAAALPPPFGLGCCLL